MSFSTTALSTTLTNSTVPAIGAGYSHISDYSLMPDTVLDAVYKVPVAPERQMVRHDDGSKVTLASTGTLSISLA
jgi:hypothetical protein